MEKYSKAELSDALKVVSSTISKCEKMQSKFNAGSPQNSLLQNRIKAMQISKTLILKEEWGNQYTIEDLANAFVQITSIINKCKAGQEKHAVENSTFVRLQKIINSMIIAQTLIDAEIRTKS